MKPPPGPDKPTITRGLARITLAGLQRLGAIKGQSLSAEEVRAVAALRRILAPERPKKAPKSNPKDRPKASPAPLPWPVGTPVMFATAGRSGVSPMRRGTVTGYKRSKGLWVEVREDGAVEWVKLWTRLSRVEPR